MITESYKEFLNSKPTLNLFSQYNLIFPTIKIPQGENLKNSYILLYKNKIFIYKKDDSQIYDNYFDYIIPKTSFETECKYYTTEDVKKPSFLINLFHINSSTKNTKYIGYNFNSKKPFLTTQKRSDFKLNYYSIIDYYCLNYIADIDIKNENYDIKMTPFSLNINNYLYYFIPGNPKLMSNNETLEYKNEKVKSIKLKFKTEGTNYPTSISSYSTDYNQIFVIEFNGIPYLLLPYKEEEISEILDHKLIPINNPFQNLLNTPINKISKDSIIINEKTNRTIKRHIFNITNLKKTGTITISDYHPIASYNKVIIGLEKNKKYYNTFLFKKIDNSEHATFEIYSIGTFQNILYEDLIPPLRNDLISANYTDNTIYELIYDEQPLILIEPLVIV